MESEMDMQQVVYRVLLTQIQFGTYRYGEHLPKMEDAAKWLLVSLDTVRAAYLRLKREGFITLTKNIGAVVNVHYTEPQIEGAIQDFFALRKEAMTDLSKVMYPLYLHAQWYSLRQATAEQLDSMEVLATQSEIPPPFSMIHHLQHIYGSLKNDLLMRLVWQTYMFFQAPFLSVPEIANAFMQGPNPLLQIIALCRQKDWAQLLKALKDFQRSLSASLSRFYAERIIKQPIQKPVAFYWSGYQKVSQVCYTLAKSLLNDICRGNYAPGSFLPSQSSLAKTCGVSLSTVRRTLALLCSAGATRSINGVGTQVLPLDESAQNCDFSNTAVRKRLLEFIQALQILAFSCGLAARITLDSVSAPAIEEWIAQIEQTKAIGRPELAIYISLEFIARFAPSQALRTVYKELDGLLLWGYPLRSLYGNREALDHRFAPSLETMLACLLQCDARGFAHELETLLAGKVAFAAAQLESLGFESGELVSLPEKCPR